MTEDKPVIEFAVFIGEARLGNPHYYATREEAEAALRRIAEEPGDLTPRDIEMLEIRPVTDWYDSAVVGGGRDLGEVLAEQNARLAEIETKHAAKIGSKGGKETAKHMMEDGPEPWRVYAEGLARRSPARLSSDSARAQWIKDHWRFEGRKCPARSTLMQMLRGLGDAG
jgi:hypothetical protein